MGIFHIYFDHLNTLFCEVTVQARVPDLSFPFINYKSYFYLFGTQAFISYICYKYLLLFGGFLSTLLVVFLQEKKF